MANDVTTHWLDLNVGEPSGSRFSSYTAIFKAVRKYEDGGSEDLNLVNQMLKMVNTYVWNKFGKTWLNTAASEKGRTSIWLSTFGTNLKRERNRLDPTFVDKLIADVALAQKENRQFPTEERKVRDVVGKMARSGIPIVANTGRGLSGESGTSWAMKYSAADNGQANDNRHIDINPLIVSDVNRLIAMLVHEYHHVLCLQPGNKAGKCDYIDEFVAWHKELSLIEPSFNGLTSSQKANKVNQKLTAKYPSDVKYWLERKFHGQPARLLNDLAEAGDYLCPDNAAPRTGTQHALK